MEKWEYKTVNTETPDINNFNMVLNQLGNVGWELVSCFTSNQEQGNIRSFIAVLKRRINSSFTDRPDRPINYQGKNFGNSDKGAPRAYGKSGGFNENRTDFPRKNSGYSGQGYKGKSSGFKGKTSGYKGNNAGNEGKGSGKTFK